MSTGDDPNQELPPETGGTLPAVKPISEVLGRGADDTPPLPVDESAAALELHLQKETDGRQEDRILFNRYRHGPCGYGCISAFVMDRDYLHLPAGNRDLVGFGEAPRKRTCHDASRLSVSSDVRENWTVA